MSRRRVLTLGTFLKHGQHISFKQRTMNHLNLKAFLTPTSRMDFDGIFEPNEKTRHELACELSFSRVEEWRFFESAQKSFIFKTKCSRGYQKRRVRPVKRNSSMIKFCIVKVIIQRLSHQFLYTWCYHICSSRQNVRQR